MKHLFFIICCIASLLVIERAKSAAIPSCVVQPVDTTLAHRITQKLQDSLQLTADQRRQVFAINCRIDSSKVSLFNLYQGQDTLNILMESLELTRDTSYQRILTDKQFVKYGMNKSSLVLNN